MAPPSNRDEVAVQMVDMKANCFFPGIGYLMNLLGKWERGPALIRKIKFEEIVEPTFEGLRKSGLKLEDDRIIHFACLLSGSTFLRLAMSYPDLIGTFIEYLYNTKEFTAG